MSQTNGLTTVEPHEPELFAVQDEPKPIIKHVGPESLTVQDELDSTTIRNEQNELYKSRGLKREVRLIYREGGRLMGF